MPYNKEKKQPRRTTGRRAVVAVLLAEGGEEGRERGMKREGEES